MAWEQVAGMAASALLGGRGAPAAPATSGYSFNNQQLDMSNHGIPAWNRTQGGSGSPPVAEGFSARPDSFVMGLTGLSTATSRAAGNGIAVQQPSALLNTALFSTTNIVLIGAIVLGVFWLKK